MSSITDKRVLKLMKKDKTCNTAEAVAACPVAIAEAKPIVASGVDLGQDKLSVRESDKKK